MADDDLTPGEEEEFDPTRQPKSSRAWLAMIKMAERDFDDYQTRCDNIDKLYASLERLANTTRSREFQLFWANVQVLGPSIYSRPPVPVVVPRFQDRRALQRTTSELLERSTVVAFEMEDIDGVMRAVRDDLTVVARGVAWVRYETKQENDGLVERVCIEHVARKDYLHDPAREWKEVDWAAKASHLTKRQMRKRFRRSSGDVYKEAAYLTRKDENDNDDGTLKARVWEIWSKSQNKVVWVSEGCDKLLDDEKPHLKLEGFFPCPKPAYATVQRGTLQPVPDFVFYKDQLEEINELTGRIAALTEAVRLRGFYPSGAGEISDAVEAALKSQSDNVVLIPVSNWAMMGSGGVKDMIVWLPLEMVVAAIAQCVEMRRQLIDDVYQITGLSDIMRGSTVASETLGAQELKSQYGSIRIRDRQDELIRLARDLTRIIAEIMAENFQSKTLLDMSQMEMETDADIAKQVKEIEQQRDAMAREIKEAQTDPEIMAMAQQNPEQAQQIVGQFQSQMAEMEAAIDELEEKPTIEKVMKLLRDQRLRPFSLDIETDSTIAPDENAQKQRATEYVTAMGGLLAQAIPAIQTVPQIAPLMADTIKFAQKQFRVGREMQSTVDEFTEQMKALAQQPSAPDPAAAKAEADVQALQMQGQVEQSKAQAAQAQAEANTAATQAKSAAEIEKIRADTAARQQDGAIKLREIEAQAARDQQTHAQAMQQGELALEKTRAEIEKIRVSTAGVIMASKAKADATAASAKETEPA